LALLVPVVSDSALWPREIALIGIMSLVVVGLNMSYGYAGELALGQAAMYAAGGYLTGVLAKQGHNDLLITLPISAAAAAIVGFVSGIPGLRLGGWSLAMVSFFLILLIPDAADILQTWTGGFAGLNAIPNMRIAGYELDQTGYYVTVIVTTTLVFAAFRNLIHSRTGAAFRVLKQSPVLASSLGIPVYRTKLLAYVAGAIPAGIAGCLFAYLDGFIAPESFGFSTSVGFLAASILGGAQSVYGSIVGATLLQLGPLRSTAFQKYSLVAYGAFLIFGGVFFSGGFAGVAGSLLRRFGFQTEAPVSALTKEGEQPDLGTYEGLPLIVSGITKKFGGVSAVDDVTIDALPGQVTAIIGPNGSGKTTLLNLISGFQRPNAGAIRFGDFELTKLAPHRVAHRGVARTFQTPAIPSGLTAAEVVSTARFAAFPVGLLSTILRLPKFRRARHDDTTAAHRVLDLLGLRHLANVQATSLPLGTRRLLEVARGLASRPGLILLDEPASGLDHEAILELASAIRRMKAAGATVVLVEHNFPLVLDLADKIHVLRRGVRIASGTPIEIRSNKEVAESYLGVVPT
jgi:branched-chain amino acid transport system permease protein